MNKRRRYFFLCCLSLLVNFIKRKKKEKKKSNNTRWPTSYTLSWANERACAHIQRHTKNHFNIQVINIWMYVCISIHYGERKLIDSRLSQPVMLLLLWLFVSASSTTFWAFLVCFFSLCFFFFSGFCYFCFNFGCWWPMCMDWIYTICIHTIWYCTNSTVRIGRYIWSIFKF